MKLSLSNELAVVQPVVLFDSQIARLDLLRLDLIHPVVSGNKWFKLKEWLDIATKGKKDGIITAGGAYSNHIVATAFAARSAGLQSVAIIRGEASALESHSLRDARAYGMAIQFTNRSGFNYIKNNAAEAGLVPDNWLFVPEGGAGPEGVKGAAAILDLVPGISDYTHICCAMGTGTMLAGLSNAAQPHQQVLGVSSLKGEDTLTEKIRSWLKPGAAPFQVFRDFHFGGYAKHPQPLLDFMNGLYQRTNIPTDIVYTGKLMFGIRKLLENGFFKDSDRILAIHSGGLQGNRSLNMGQLVFL